MKLRLEEIAQAMSAATALSGEVSSYSIDSRTLAPGDLFFALRGDTHDGHAYVRDALARGAAAAVVHEDLGEDPRLIRVDDTLRALQALAFHARRSWGGTVVGITGSAGKTSTKDVVAALLAAAMPVGRTVGNFNNHIGVPVSILRLPDEAAVGVLEVGMNHPGEIRALSEIAAPQIGIVTNVGHAHIENFPEGVDGIALAKRELVESLPETGTAILNYDDVRVRAFAEVHSGRTLYYGFSPEAEVRATDVELHEKGVRFRVGDTSFESALAGRHAVSNILAGLAAAQVLGVDKAGLRGAVGSLEPGKMRGERIERDGVLIINDCYNSNPDAARSMLDLLRDTPARRRIAVLGEMLELGRWADTLHRDVGGYAAQCGISVLVGIRGVAQALVEGAIQAGLQKDAAYFFDDPAEAGKWLRSLARPGDAILFKGSRGTRVERALDEFLAQSSR